MPGQEFDQGVIGLAVDRRRREPDLHPIPMLSRKFGARSTGLDVQVEDQTLAAAARRCPTKMIRTCSRIRRISGEMSNWPRSGTKRRIGRRNGRVRASNTGANGVYGFT